MQSRPEEVDTVLGWLEAIYSPQATPDANLRRVTASRLLEEFREGSDRGAAVGFVLAEAGRPLIVCHCGLQFLEHFVRFRWLKAPVDDKIRLKDALFKLLGEGSPEAVVREGIAKCVVEMLKHEWPQHWPTFLAELKALLQTQSVACLSIVLVIFTRLLEEVVSLQTIQHAKRRQELRQALVESVAEIVELALAGLDSGHDELGRAATAVLGELLGWVPAAAMARGSWEGVVVKTSGVLANERLRGAAVDVLLQLVARKANSKNAAELGPIIILFHPPVIQAILAAASDAAEKTDDEESYEFLKSVSSLHTSMGLQLANLWGAEKQGSYPVSSAPDTFALYMDALDSFLAHPSLWLRSQAVTVLQAMVTHNQISADDTFRAHLAHFLRSAPDILSKYGRAGDPEPERRRSCELAELDFDGAESAKTTTELAALRSRAHNVAQLSVSVDFTIGYGVVEQWVRDSLTTGNILGNEEYDPMVKVSQKFLEALHSNADAIGGLGSLSGRRSALLSGLVSALESPSSSYRVANNQLPLIGTLLAQLPPDAALCQRLLSVFSRFMLSQSAEEDSRYLKLHICSQLINLSKLYSAVIDPSELIALVSLWWPAVSGGQKSKLVESLALLANNFASPADQACLLRQIAEPSLAYFGDNETVQAVSDPSKLLRAFGMTSPEPADENDATILFRKEMMGHVGIVEALVVRVTERTETPTHPLAALFHVQPQALTTLFLLVRSLNGLPSVCAELHPSYSAAVLDVPEVERLSVQMGNPEQLSEASEAGRFRKTTHAHHLCAFVSDLTEKMQIIMGGVVSRWGGGFWDLREAEPYLQQGILGFDQHVLDLRLRFWLRRFWQPLVKYLNGATTSDGTRAKATEPLKRVIEETFKRIQSRWALVETNREKRIDKDRKQEVAEMYIEDVSAVVSREFVQFLKGSGVPSESAPLGSEEDEEMGAKGSSGRPALALSGVASQLLAAPDSAGVLLGGVFSALCWRDSRSVHGLLPLCRAAFGSAKEGLDAPSGAYLLGRVVDGLGLHGQEEGIVGPALLLASDIYASLRPRLPELRDALLANARCSEDELAALDAKINAASADPGLLPEKGRKEIMRKILKSVIGVPPFLP